MSRTHAFLVPLGAACAVLMGAASPAHTAEPWNTLKQQQGANGWTLYSRTRPGSSFVEYRIVANVDASPRVAAAAARRLLVEPDRLPAGVRRTILRDEGGVIVSHSRFGMPGPLSDRDVVLRIEAFELPSGAQGFRWTSAPELGPKASGGVVRMRESSGAWEFTPTATGGSTVVGLMHGDLGGHIPAFLVNRLAGDSLVTDLGHIRELAKPSMAVKP